MLVIREAGCAGERVASRQRSDSWGMLEVAEEGEIRSLSDPLTTSTSEIAIQRHPCLKWKCTIWMQTSSYLEEGTQWDAGNVDSALTIPVFPFFMPKKISASHKTGGISLVWLCRQKREWDMCFTWDDGAAVKADKVTAKWKEKWLCSQIVGVSTFSHSGLDPLFLHFFSPLSKNKLEKCFGSSHFWWREERFFNLASCN